MSNQPQCRAYGEQSNCNQNQACIWGCTSGGDCFCANKKAVEESGELGHRLVASFIIILVILFIFALVRRWCRSRRSSIWGVWIGQSDSTNPSDPSHRNQHNSDIMNTSPTNARARAIPRSSRAATRRAVAINNTDSGGIPVAEPLLSHESASAGEIVHSAQVVYAAETEQTNHSARTPLLGMPVEAQVVVIADDTPPTQRPSGYRSVEDV